jgi:glucokinase
VTGPASAGARAAYGVDVGGTKILGVALSPEGDVLAERRVPTPDALGPLGGGEDAVAVLAVAVAGVVQALGADPRAGPGTVLIGVGLPGFVIDGVLRFSPHLPRAATPPGAPASSGFAARLAAALPGVTAVVHNDSNLAALAELVLGAARGMRDGLVLTLGTGIGGALVVDGSVHGGAHGIAAEVGHMVVDPAGPQCPCGGRGCWERYASGGGLARLAREAALAGSIPEAVALAGGHPELVRGEHVTAAAAAGDPGSLRVVEELGWWLALGLANLAALTDPERVVLGGGLVAAGEMLLAPARRAFATLVVGKAARPDTPIVAAALGERAGAIGAALAAGRLLGARPPGP